MFSSCFLIANLIGLIGFNELTVNLITPTTLNSLSSSTVYSVIQDSQGAMWFNTSSGPYRYNGHSLTDIGVSSSTYLAKFATSDKTVFYLNNPDGLYKFSVSGSNSSVPETIASSLPENSPLLAEEDTLFFGRHNVVYAYHDGSTKAMATLRNGCHVRSLNRLGNGDIIVATYESDIGVLSDGVFQSCISLNSSILATFLSDSGVLWAGTSKDGLLKIDTRDFTILGRYFSPDSHPLLDVRCFAEDREGNLFFGAASGLFLLDSKGEVKRIPIDGVDINSVCDVFIDSEGNLWVSIYDNGVYCANLTSFPFVHLTEGMTIGTTRGIQISDRTIYVAADPGGILSFRDGVWSSVPGLDDYKFQSSYCDPLTMDLFLGNWDGLVRYNPKTKKCSEIPFAHVISVGSRIPVFSVLRHGCDLYIGTPIGAFLFNPDKEDVISRRVEFVNKRINSIVERPDGGLLLAGDGLFYLTEDGVDEIEEYASLFFTDVRYDKRGDVWTGLSPGGILKINKGDEDVIYDKQNCGLPDDQISYVIPLDDSTVVAGTSLGITILDPVRRSCQNFDRSNGLRMKSTSRGGSFFMPDGRVLLGGNGAIEILNPSEIIHSGSKSSLTFDSVSVNGRQYGTDYKPGAALVLDHKANNISFDIATFDYSPIESYIYSYNIEGVDSEWHQFDIRQPVRCLNLGSGHYTLRVRESDYSESVLSEIAMPITIMPVWYLSLPFIILWNLLIFFFTAFTIYNIYARKTIKRRLLLEEEYNARQSDYFIDLSYKIRTPLNLMIGQIERYFKEYGARARGAEHVQDVYNQATHIRGLISDFVDSSGEKLEFKPKYYKLLNTAIGAVERNLFSGNLDVPLLCKELNMGKTKLTEQLKEASGMTPREFIEDVRLRHAAQMMLDGNHTVTEVSDILGFSTPKYFTVKFSKKFGCSPREYGRRGGQSDSVSS